MAGADLVASRLPADESDSSPAPTSGSRRLWLSLVSIAISVALLAWALRGVQPSEIVAHVTAARLLPLALAIAVATSTFVIRMFRWRLLLRDDDGRPVTWSGLWHGVAIGFMANNILPFRAGEFLRSYVVSRLGGVRFSAAFSSVAVERVFDALAVVVFLVVGLLGAQLPSVEIAGVSVARMATVAGLMGVGALAAAGAVVAWPLAAERLVRRLIPSPSLAERLVGLIEGVRHGLGVLRSPGRLAGVAVWSAILWLVNAYSFYLAFGAFDIPVGYSGALLLQGLLVIGISVPSTPGFIGPFEAAIVAVLALYAVPHDRAFSYAITYHLTTLVPITLLGLWSVARTPIDLRDLRRRPAP